MCSSIPGWPPKSAPNYAEAGRRSERSLAVCDSDPSGVCAGGEKREYGKRGG